MRIDIKIRAPAPSNRSFIRKPSHVSRYWNCSNCNTCNYNWPGFWFAAEFACHDHSPPAPWPAWLRDALTPPPRPAVQYRGPINPNRAIAGISRRLSVAQEGERNALLFWAACRLAERGMRQQEVEALLIPIAINVGLTDSGVRRTITSAQGRAAA